MKRAARYFDIWVDEAWERFEIQWNTEAYRARCGYTCTTSARETDRRAIDVVRRFRNASGRTRGRDDQLRVVSHGAGTQ